MPNPLDDAASADYTDQYNTPLTPEQEWRFQRDMGHRLADLRDYDLRGAWLANAQATANGHLTDIYKKPNHPTFSVNSQYSTPQAPGGLWAQFPSSYSNDPTAPWAFMPGAGGQYSGDLEDYFRRVEPTNYLLRR